MNSSTIFDLTLVKLIHVDAAKKYTIVTIAALVLIIVFLVYFNTGKNYNKKINDLTIQSEMAQKEYLLSVSKWKSKLDNYQDSVIILGIIIDSLEDLKQKSVIKYITIEDKRTTDVAAIRSNSDTTYQTEFLANWLDNRKRQSGVVVGGSPIN